MWILRRSESGFRHTEVIVACGVLVVYHGRNQQPHIASWTMIVRLNTSFEPTYSCRSASIDRERSEP